eukprot:21007-Alexandrium_andersonii.AAC.1
MRPKRRVDLSCAVNHSGETPHRWYTPRLEAWTPSVAPRFDLEAPPLAQCQHLRGQVFKLRPGRESQQSHAVART